MEVFKLLNEVNSAYNNLFKFDIERLLSHGKKFQTFFDCIDEIRLFSNIKTSLKSRQLIYNKICKTFMK